MSDQNSTTPDPNDAVPGYQPPSTPESGATATPPSYTPPAAPEPPAYTPPPAGGYEPPAPGGYSAPAAGGYSQPAGFPEPPGPSAYPPPPPAAPYGQPGQPGAYNTGYPAVPAGPTGPGGAVLADWPKRALGGLVDYVAPAIVIGIVSSIVINNISWGLGTALQWILWIAWYCYLGYKSGTTGVTFGRSLAKTKLVALETGQVVGVQTGIIRQFAHIIDSAICGIGFLFPLWDAQKQTLADKIMKTVVIDNSADPNAGTYNWG